MRNVKWMLFKGRPIHWPLFVFGRKYKKRPMYWSNLRVIAMWVRGISFHGLVNLCEAGERSKLVVVLALPKFSLHVTFL